MTDADIIRALAEKVMGWERHCIGKTNFVEDFAWFNGGKKVAIECSDVILSAIHQVTYWNPLTSDTDSCAVLDKMVETGWSYSISANPPWSSCLPGTLVEFNKGVHPPAFLEDRGEYDFPSHIDDRRRAICIAALKAVGAWED